MEQIAHGNLDSDDGLTEFPSPHAQPGWYPDPFGSTAERYWDGTWQDATRESQLRLGAAAPENGSQADSGSRSKAEGLLAPFRRVPDLAPRLGRTAREERARQKEQQRRLMAIEAEREAFFRSPAGRARLSFERGHSVFQFELAINDLEPIAIPGPIGSPPRETIDAVEILNSVVVEGWKFVNGKFMYVELRNGVIGCYLFKRSSKRWREMAEPWQSL